MGKSGVIVGWAKGKKWFGGGRHVPLVVSMYTRPLTAVQQCSIAAVVQE